MASPPPESKILCPNCRTAFEADAKFCARCGVDLRGLNATAPETPIGDRATAPIAALGRAATEVADPFINRVIDSRYRVICRVGSGGMGVVYKVEHQRMGKIAAMKVLHADLAHDKDVIKRFQHEAKAVSKLNHPNTVHTFDFGTADGQLYLVMEYLRGEDLGAIVRRDGPLSFRRGAPIFLQICGALGEAHELGIVHRDLKPENILVTRSKDGHDHAKVLDFGLAKLSERDESADITGRGEIIGTPYYMSPEQIRGEPLDQRSDIYSLGGVMYRVLTGEPPFQAQSPVGVLTKHLTEDLIPPQQRRPDLRIDERVGAIIQRALAKQPEARYASADELAHDLEAVVEELRDESPTRTVRRAVSESDASGPVLTPVRLDRRQGTSGGSTHEPRLHREDFDAYERSVRRGVWLRGAIVPLVLLGGVGGAYLILRAPHQVPQRVEIEPNNDLTTATLIASGQSVRGKIGQRIAQDRGDRDFFKIHAHGWPGGRMKLVAHLSPIPNIDLALVAHDHAGRVLGVADALGVGEPEVLPNLSAADDVIYLEVRESDLVPLRAPSENLSDEYELAVTVARAADDEELEPNDIDSDATPLRPGMPMRGTFGRLGDVDCYRFAGPEGEYDVQVTGADKIDVRVGVGVEEPHAVRRLRTRLLPNGIVRLVRADPPARPGQRPIAPGVEEIYTLVVKPAR